MSFLLLTPSSFLHGDLCGAFHVEVPMNRSFHGMHLCKLPRVRIGSLRPLYIIGLILLAPIEIILVDTQGDILLRGS